ncbi:mechanosensitive ion channel family protein [Proteobacteria bacterium 005FR1]|nr:mechanosensitive ion channel family protein [Proteobacteria bacterium 005FR1]
MKVFREWILERRILKRSCRTRQLSGLLLTVVMLAAVTPTALDANPVAPLKGESAEATASEAEKPADPLGRTTPRGTFEGYIKAVSQENYQRAAQYLDLAPLPLDKRIRAEQMARILQQALDRNGTVRPAVMLSSEPAGQVDDNLPPEYEHIGSLQIGARTVPVKLQQLQSADGPIWLISADTLDQLPREVRAESTLPINHYLPDSLIENKLYGVPWGHWIAMVLLGGLCYLISRGSVAAVSALARALLHRKFTNYPEGLVRAFAVPARLFIGVLIFVYVMQRTGVSIIVRQYLSDALVIVGWISLSWLVWRLVDVIASLSEQRMTLQARFGALSAVRLMRRTFRVLLVAVAIVVALGMAGLDVTTGLAALGIGGIVFALGAQKMVENLVGSMSVVLDQTVRIGDFCRIGDTLGTIEQIGMRTTRIRTLDRTLVTIPNADFASQKIENYTHRDRFLFRPLLTVRYETSPDQIRTLLTTLRAVLQVHPQVDPEARVTFLGFGSSALNVEIFGYILATDYSEFLEIQEELNLQIAEALSRSGTSLAYPSQTLYLANDRGVAGDRGRTNERGQHAGTDWREPADVKLPNFAAEPLKQAN